MFGSVRTIATVLGILVLQRAAQAFMAALTATGAARSLAEILVHDWDSRITPDPEGITEPFRTSFQRPEPALQLQIT